VAETSNKENNQSTIGGARYAVWRSEWRNETTGESFCALVVIDLNAEDRLSGAMNFLPSAKPEDLARAALCSHHFAKRLVCAGFSMQSKASRVLPLVPDPNDEDGMSLLDVERKTEAVAENWMAWSPMESDPACPGVWWSVWADIPLDERELEVMEKRLRSINEREAPSLDVFEEMGRRGLAEMTQMAIEAFGKQCILGAGLFDETDDEGFGPRQNSRHLVNAVREREAVSKAMNSKEKRENAGLAPKTRRGEKRL